MLSANFVTFAFCKLFFCHDSLESVASIDAFKVDHLPAAKKEYLITLFQICPFSCYQLISEHFGKNCVILLQMVAK